MAAIERTVYPRFKPSLTATELQDLYCPTDEERDFLSTQARGASRQLMWHCQLKEMVLKTLPLTVRFRTCLGSRIPLRTK